ncbi:glycosyltransferase [Leucobacter sp. wl10]|uniref:glycosyltransferase n=1 Tax=Leucobacter sp. wl10 TaxID=2304677 RepID=UPI000E5C5734|nr:glycosyltransferase [Leucobacter sp. wl10]RGE23196.1 glycosyltransferase [Leucobacter sp. wl10]
MRAGPRVLVFPAWRDNPYLNLLGLNPQTAGYAFLRTTSFHGLLERLDELRDGDVAHIHWTTPILQNADTEEEASRRLAEFSAALEHVRGRGVSIVWTLHNRLPHETRYRELEVELYRVLERAADTIHVMAPATAEVVADVVRLSPEKVRVIPHPSYTGIYDTGFSRAAARDSFQLGADDYGVLFLGQIRPYKGVDALAAAAGIAQRPDKRLALMLAGAVKDVPLEAFLDSLPSGVRTVSHFGFVPDGDLDRWFTAADVAVLPYRAILNSGSLHLAATFRVPVVLPDEAHLREQFGALPWVAFFDTERPVESIAEMLGDPGLFAGVTGEDFDRFNAEITPWKVSRRYRELLDELTRDSRPLTR